MPMPSPDPSAAAAAARRADLDACRALLRKGSRSFHAASLLLPRRVREPTAALYAFCRLADDAVDKDGAVDLEGMAAPGAAASAVARPAVLDRLRLRLERAYAGAPLPHPVDRAFAAAVAQHGIPRAWPEALLEGLAWDAEGRRYQDLAALRAYAVRVAGTVGAMMALLMGASSGAALARAADLGIAMQLTNIARDVGEDARAGRLYLPLEWMWDAGLDPEAWLAHPVHDGRLAQVVRRLLAEAAPLYARGAAGLAYLPADCRPAIAAAGAIYAEIGAEVARRDWDSVGGRAVVPARRKLRLLAGAFVGSAAAGAAGQAAPPVPEACFLVTAAVAAAEAAGAAPSPPPPPPPRDAALAATATRWRRPDADLPVWATARARGLWLFDLFTELDQLDRQRRQGTPLSTASSAPAAAVQ